MKTMLWLALGVRLGQALLMGNTFFQPDEYWQSLEVAHRMAFGYGHLTWEWAQRLRGALHPALFAAYYWLLLSLGIVSIDGGKDSLGELWWITTGPRVIQAVLSAVADYAAYKLTDKLLGPAVARWTMALSLTSWFHAYCATRTFANTAEMALSTMALALWPLTSREIKYFQWSRFYAAVFLAGLSCAIRPTAGLFWFVAGIQLLVRLQTLKQMASIAVNAAAVLSIALGLSAIADWHFYGEWTLTVVTFLRVNLVESISLFYGTHPWHWYLTQGVPVLLTTFLPFCLIGLWWTLRDSGAIQPTRPLAVLLGVNIAVYSLLAHKEFRFIYPLLPLMLVFAAMAMHNHYVRHWGSNQHRVLPLFSAVFIVQLLMGIYVSTVHQRGVMQAMTWLNQNVPDAPGSNVFFMMPCHSTPYYSHLHRNVTMTFLTCEPPLGVGADQLGLYRDETDVFFTDPVAYLQKHWRFLPTYRGGGRFEGLRKAPTDVVLFEALLKQSPTVTDAFWTMGLQKCARFFNSHLIDDDRRVGDVIIYCKR